ncbi:hypothetical protein BDV95DRAFT_609329 [Massariosphaeria phaeospora]|uniref:Uncharacterized protein n=1 Tax=Massariosphaeria phaeospora TaxID=100035 RepID=A0A7C8MGT7_9PLEO|nr:hypothetical protein BDV95DRAFT_609329 [Massariosphaeria phaeospora]
MAAMFPRVYLLDARQARRCLVTSDGWWSGPAEAHTTANCNLAVDGPSCVRTSTCMFLLEAIPGLALWLRPPSCGVRPLQRAHSAAVRVPPSTRPLRTQEHVGAAGLPVASCQLPVASCQLHAGLLDRPDAGRRWPGSGAGQAAVADSGQPQRRGSTFCTGARRQPLGRLQRHWQVVSAGHGGVATAGRHAMCLAGAGHVRKAAPTSALLSPLQPPGLSPTLDVLAPGNIPDRSSASLLRAPLLESPADC